MPPLALLLVILAVGCRGEVKPDGKRSPQSEYSSPSGQYSFAPPSQPQQLPPEYLSLYQQLQGRAPGAAGPSQLQQSLYNTAPQQYVLSSQQPQQPPLTPEAERNRQVQEAIANQHVREQEERDNQRQSQAAYLQYQQAVGGLPAPQGPALQYFASASAPAPTPQPAPLRYQQVSAQQPQRVSYSQVQFGSSTLPRQRAAPQPPPRAIKYTYAPAPQPQQVSYEEASYDAAQRQASAYLQAQQAYAQAPQAYREPKLLRETYQSSKSLEEAKAELPQQYLIETTKPEQPKAYTTGREAPQSRPVIYYTSNPGYQQPTVLTQQSSSAYARQPQSTPAPPSRSSIFVSTSRTPTLKTYKVPAQLAQREPEKEYTYQGSDLDSLYLAGYRVVGSGEAPQAAQESPYATAPKRLFYSSGRQEAKIVPRPVPLSAEERESLSKQGIRNLYRIEGTESQERPLTYVLALDNKGSQHQ